MQLEQTLQMYDVDTKREDGLVGEIYTSGLEMYTSMGIPSFRAPSAPYGGTLGGPRPLSCGSPVIRPMKPTETFRINLDPIYPKLNLIEKYHPPNIDHELPSYEAIFGIKKKKGLIFSDGKINL